MAADTATLRALAEAARDSDGSDLVVPRVAATSRAHARYLEAGSEPGPVLAVLDELEAARAVLREVEWLWSDAGQQGECPLCGAGKGERFGPDRMAHGPDCKLARALGK